MGNILGKKKADEDQEVQKLRQKFNEIVNSPAQVQTAMPAQAAQPSYQMVDPQKAEDNERITNLIMQQIKELIEIDNNLNAKLKDLENKLGSNATIVAQTKSIVEQFNSRLELIEKNMEKFMGLYEVVTNRFNPFITENEHTEAVEVTPKKTVEPKIEENAREIMVKSGLQSKLDNDQQELIVTELEKAVGLLGTDTIDKVKVDMSAQLAKAVGDELRKSLSQHMKLSNEDLKNSLKEMLLETVTHLRQPQPTGPSLADNAHPDYHFYLPNGTPIRNVVELKNALKTMDAATFKGHVDGKRNDFADWIRLVYKRNDVADQLAKLTDRQSILKYLERIS